MKISKSSIILIEISRYGETADLSDCVKKRERSE